MQRAARALKGEEKEAAERAMAELDAQPAPDLQQAVHLINQANEALILSLPGQYLWAYARYKQPRREPALSTQAS
jgi:lauroyl/myristoyl acyltransferase